ncbi:hypothetical protein AB0F71_31705 [Kitasatospora sp. NPDC028055]|uniref:hypothetical protein n=1 Tax=Kitasatospora sp. NPDC028055 TaxID=3155653 RepID=UPI0033CB0B8B
MAESSCPPGSVGLQLVEGLPLLRPEQQVFEAMLEGWRNQQLARNLSPGYIQAHERAVRALADHADAMPWEWTAANADDWFADLRAVHGCVRGTLRNYQTTIRLFCDFLTDPAYGWAERACATSEPTPSR